tara:strand:+ start:102 stop:701 length:600 start_codon:yes stop_codon:yes gene_type:complete
MSLQFFIHYWGPLLFRIKLKTEDIKAVRKICDGGTEKYNTQLAGIIDNEIKIDETKYNKILQPYLEAFKDAFKMWYLADVTEIKMNNAWVNYMKKGESNPPHIHHRCNMSSVLLLQVPATLKKEQRDWTGSGMGPGVLSFSTGNPHAFHTNSFEFKPEAGDFFMFPWNLTHTVSSYKSNSTRISVAANFSLNSTGVFYK